MSRLLVLFFLYVFFSSCGEGMPEGIVPREKMVPLLTDLHLADGYVSSIYGDSTTYKTASVYKALYKKYDTDSAGLRKTLAYYATQPDELELIYKEVEAKLTELEKAEQKRAAKMQQDALRKQKREEAIARNKKRIAEIKAKMLKGEYDFGLSIYKSPAERFFKMWKKYPVPSKTATKSDSVKTDSSRKDSLLKKEPRE